MARLSVNNVEEFFWRGDFDEMQEMRSRNEITDAEADSSLHGFE